MKPCLNCGADISRLKDHNRRKYCSLVCMGKHWTRKAETPANGRSQAGRKFRYLKKCLRCPSTYKLQRHHKDGDATNNAPDNVEILCRQCHRALHRKKPRVSVCVVCGREFVAKWKRLTAKCCSAPCVSAWGRICALKRWGEIV